MKHIKTIMSSDVLHATVMSMHVIIDNDGNNDDDDDEEDYDNVTDFCLSNCRSLEATTCAVCIVCWTCPRHDIDSY